MICDKIVGASLSEPHTSVTALLDACVCMCRVCLRVAIYRKFKLSERISNLHTCYNKFMFGEVATPHRDCEP